MHDSHELAALLLSKLDKSGEPVPNLKLRLQMQKALSASISDVAFYAARDALLAKGKVGRSSGQGGKTFLVVAPPDHEEEDPPPTTPQGKAWPESRLMDPLGTYLEGPFQRTLELEAGRFVVQDTSKAGPLTGHWERPDYVLVAVSRYRHLPGVQVDVHSFELKTESGGGVQGVHEALGHTRHVDFGYLVWHLPAGSKYENRLRAVERSCLEHGIGLILMREPTDPSLSEILVDPRRKRTERTVVDEFLNVRLNPENLAALERLVRQEGGG